MPLLIALESEFIMLLFRRLSVYLSLICLTSLSTVALASAPTLIPAPPQIAAKSYIVMDANSGEVIVEKNADERLDPASLTKMMTAYVAEYEIRQGNIALDDQVQVSTNAWAQKFPGSSVMFLEPGKPVTVRELIKGVDIASGNDATVALAEHIAGSAGAFVDLMNQHSQLLGLKNTHFVNPHGLTGKDHYSSARDMAILARAQIIEFPEGYKTYAQKEFTYNGIRQPNRNRLLWRDSSVDGLKTGHTDAAGYCLVASALRDDMRLIVVVMGTHSDEARFQETQKLFSFGFRFYKTVKLYNKGQELAKVDVWGGEKDQLGVQVAEDVYVTIPRSQEDGLSADLSLDKYVQAVVKKGQTLGEIEIKLNNESLLKQPVIASETVEKGSFLGVLWSKIKLFFVQLIGG